MGQGEQGPDPHRLRPRIQAPYTHTNGNTHTATHTHRHPSFLQSLGERKKKKRAERERRATSTLTPPSKRAARREASAAGHAGVRGHPLASCAQSGRVGNTRRGCEFFERQAKYARHAAVSFIVPVSILSTNKTCIAMVLYHYDCYGRRDCGRQCHGDCGRQCHGDCGRQCHEAMLACVSPCTLVRQPNGSKVTRYHTRHCGVEFDKACSERPQSLAPRRSPSVTLSAL